MSDAPERLEEKLRYQARSCARLGSPLYAAILEAAADDVLARGPVWPVLAGREDDPGGSALALRLMAAVHRLVLGGRAPELAAHYPSAGGRKGVEGAPAVFLATVERHAGDLRTDVARPLQTNEVGRCAALVGGFLSVARTFGLPLRVLEIGASAGLNLRWDHYRYEARGQTWGPAGSPVRLCAFNTERVPPFDAEATVVERAGCDPSPIDALTEEGRRDLLSYVWADQTSRIRLLRAAVDVARRVPASVETSSAAPWLERRLGKARPDVATVVFHSIVLPYLDEGEQLWLADAISAAGERAGPGSPLAWLRMEPANGQTDVHLTTWPEGETRLIAKSGYHGTAVRWLGD